MVAFNILAGGPGSFILRYLFTPGSGVNATGTLTVQGNFTTGQNPTWLALHPKNASILYAVNEIDPNPGALQSFVVGSDATLSPPVDTVTSGGAGPPFVNPLPSGNVAVVNFGGGNARIFPPNDDALHFNQSADQSASLITFPPPAGGISKPHSVYEFGTEMLVSDLGADKTWRVGQSPSGQFSITGSIPHATGSGPRHAVIKDDKILTIHELDNSLTIHSIATAQLLANVSVAPTDPGVPPGAKFAAAEILYPPRFNGSTDDFVYASNRNTGDPDPRGDSIAIFQHVAGSDDGSARAVSRRKHRRATEELNLVAQVFTGLQQIRSMAFSDDGQFLVAGGAKSGGVKVFQRTDGGKGLQEMASNDDEDIRTAFVWI